jgi:hypothetical protein
MVIKYTGWCMVRKKKELAGEEEKKEIDLGLEFS